MLNKTTRNEFDCPKTLLIVAGNYQGGGQIFLRDALLPFSRNSVIRYSLVQTDQPAMTDQWHGFKNIIDVHPPEVPPARLKFPRAGPLNYAISPWFYFRTRSRTVQRYADRIRSLVREAKIERLLIVLNSPFVIWLANELIKRQTSISSIVWDPPESFITTLSFPRTVANILLRDFENVIRNSLVLGTASEGMRTEYLRKFRKDSIVLIHAISGKLFRSTKEKPISDKTLLIGFAGNFYAMNEWNALIMALDEVNWQIMGRQVKIDVLGNGLFVRSTNANAQIVFLGWRDLEETIRILCKTDLGYLPYWMDPSRSYTTRLTFPNKISTYLAAGIPILYHGPSEASPAKYLSKYPVGLCCYSLETKEILEKLQFVVSNSNFLTEAAKSINKAREDELNLAEFQLRFKRLLAKCEIQ